MPDYDYARQRRFERPAAFDYASFRDIPPRRRPLRWLTIHDSIWGKHEPEAVGTHGDWRGTDWTLRLFGRALVYSRNRAPLGDRAITLHGKRYTTRTHWQVKRPIVLRRKYQGWER